jgi:hypothetical protein
MDTQPRFRSVDGGRIRTQERQSSRLRQRGRHLEERNVDLSFACLHTNPHIPVVVGMVSLFALFGADA